MPIAVNDTEEKVIRLVRESSAELIALVTELVVVRHHGAQRRRAGPRRGEAPGGARPRASRRSGRRSTSGSPSPRVPATASCPTDLDFKGRPQLAARLAGSGGGRSLLLNGHIDAVTPGPLDDWASDPFVVSEREGYLWGRGVNDMKGGLASMLFALETAASGRHQAARRRRVLRQLRRRVVGRRQPGLRGPRRQGRRRHLRRAHGLRRVGRLPRHGDAHHHGAGAAPVTPRCRTPTGARAAP